MKKELFHVGLVGTGLVGKRRARSLLHRENCRLRLVCDVDLAQAEFVARQHACRATTDWREVIQDGDVDVVIVATPTAFHMPIGVAAMEQGKHVLCEKPMARNADEAFTMVQASRENEVCLKIGFNHRHLPNVAKAYEFVRAGEIGELMYARACYGHGGRTGYQDEWRTKPDLAGGGELLSQGSHILDLFRWFMGDFAEATGYLTTAFWDVSPLEDNAFVLLRTHDSKIASMHVSWTQWKNLFSLEIFGKKGFVHIEGRGGSYGPEKVSIAHRPPESGPPLLETIQFPGRDESWDLEWDEFMQAIMEGREALGSGYEGWVVTLMSDVIYEAARTGKATKIVIPS